ncbi:hypothetical protein C8R46DRAFT_1164685 [Mycena filopes]|nr:hypothetical protein C8R46DRAFT_1164685 [Mycena filopes]
MPHTSEEFEYPILIWMLSLNRDYTEKEYDVCHKIVKECVPHIKIPHNPKDTDSFRKLVSHMLPLAMMRIEKKHRRHWRDSITETGKHWIVKKDSDVKIGYHLANFGASLCGMVTTQGKDESRVVRIGLGIKQISVGHRKVSVRTYAESMAHKLTALEWQHLIATKDDEVLLRRLCLILSLKAAYLDAIAQSDIDWGRLEFDVTSHTARIDSQPLLGWEFRLFTSCVGVARGDVLATEQYQCASAFLRSTKDSEDPTFLWYQPPTVPVDWVQYMNFDDLIVLSSKLMQ